MDEFVEQVGGSLAGKGPRFTHAHAHLHVMTHALTVLRQSCPFAALHDRLPLLLCTFARMLKLPFPSQSSQACEQLRSVPEAMLVGFLQTTYVHVYIPRTL